MFSKIRGKVAPTDKVLTGNELATQEGLASASFEKAENYENSGKLRQARDLYKSIAKSYPNTTVGAESQFRVARIRDKEGDGRKAYEEYETLISKYRSSPHFQDAIERQFAISEDLRTSGRKGMFGLGASIQPSDLKKMYEKIADAAPYTQYAPRSLMAIGALNASEGLKPQAIRSYQSVVDNYRGTGFAKDAQFEIYKLRGQAAENSNSPSEDRAQVDAGLDFVAQNPNDARSEMVKAGLEDIEERSLEKMYKTGQFYEESGNHKSALVYYRDIVKRPDSKHYAAASARIAAIQQILANGEPEEKPKLFGQLPSLPKIEKPKFRLGKKDEADSDDQGVLEVPAGQSSSPVLPGQ